METLNIDVGDKLRIVEDIPHNKFIKKSVIVGEIQQITDYTITIKRIRNGQLTNNTSFNIATFKDKRFHFFLEVNKEWKPIVIKITEHSDGKHGGGKYA